MNGRQYNKIFRRIQLSNPSVTLVDADVSNPSVTLYVDADAFAYCNPEIPEDYQEQILKNLIISFSKDHAGDYRIPFIKNSENLLFDLFWVDENGQLTETKVSGQHQQNNPLITLNLEEVNAEEVPVTLDSAAINTVIESKRKELDAKRKELDISLDASTVRPLPEFISYSFDEKTYEQEVENIFKLDLKQARSELANIIEANGVMLKTWKEIINHHKERANNIVDAFRLGNKSTYGDFSKEIEKERSYIINICDEVTLEAGKLETIDLLCSKWFDGTKDDFVKYKEAEAKEKQLKKLLAWHLYEAARQYYEYVIKNEELSEEKIKTFNYKFSPIVSIDKDRLSSIENAYDFFEKKSLDDIKAFISNGNPKGLLQRCDTSTSFMGYGIVSDALNYVCEQLADFNRICKTQFSFSEDICAIPAITTVIGTAYKASSNKTQFSWNDNAYQFSQQKAELLRLRSIESSVKQRPDNEFVDLEKENHNLVYANVINEDEDDIILFTDLLACITEKSKSILRVIEKDVKNIESLKIELTRKIDDIQGIFSETKKSALRLLSSLQQDGTSQVEQTKKMILDINSLQQEVKKSLDQAISNLDQAEGIDIVYNQKSKQESTPYKTYRQLLDRLSQSIVSFSQEWTAGYITVKKSNLDDSKNKLVALEISSYKDDEIEKTIKDATAYLTSLHTVSAEIKCFYDRIALYKEAFEVISQTQQLSRIVLYADQPMPKIKSYPRIENGSMLDQIRLNQIRLKQARVIKAVEEENQQLKIMPENLKISKKEAKLIKQLTVDQLLEAPKTIETLRKGLSMVFSQRDNITRKREFFSKLEDLGDRVVRIIENKSVITKTLEQFKKDLIARGYQEDHLPGFKEINQKVEQALQAIDTYLSEVSTTLAQADKAEDIKAVLGKAAGVIESAESNKVFIIQSTESVVQSVDAVEARKKEVYFEQKKNGIKSAYTTFTQKLNEKGYSEEGKQPGLNEIKSCHDKAINTYAQAVDKAKESFSANQQIDKVNATCGDLLGCIDHFDISHTLMKRNTSLILEKLSQLPDFNQLKLDLEKTKAEFAAYVDQIDYTEGVKIAQKIEEDLKVTIKTAQNTAELSKISLSEAKGSLQVAAVVDTSKEIAEDIAKEHTRLSNLIITFTKTAHKAIQLRRQQLREEVDLFVGDMIGEFNEHIKTVEADLDSINAQSRLLPSAVAIVNSIDEIEKNKLIIADQLIHIKECAVAIQEIESCNDYHAKKDQELKKLNESIIAAHQEAMLCLETINSIKIKIRHQQTAHVRQLVDDRNGENERWMEADRKKVEGMLNDLEDFLQSPDLGPTIKEGAINIQRELQGILEKFETNEQTLNKLNLKLDLPKPDIASLKDGAWGQHIELTSTFYNGFCKGVNELKAELYPIVLSANPVLSEYQEKIEKLRDENRLFKEEEYIKQLCAAVVEAFTSNANLNTYWPVQTTRFAFWGGARITISLLDDRNEEAMEKIVRVPHTVAAVHRLQNNTEYHDWQDDAVKAEALLVKFIEIFASSVDIYPNKSGRKKTTTAVYQWMKKLGCKDADGNYKLNMENFDLKKSPSENIKDQLDKLQLQSKETLFCKTLARLKADQQEETSSALCSGGASP